MDEPKVAQFQTVGYYRFRLVRTILYFTGMRLQEAGNVTEQQWEELIQHKKIQIYMPKSKRHRFIAIPEQGKIILQQTRQEAELVFNFSEQQTKT